MQDLTCLLGYHCLTLPSLPFSCIREAWCGSLSYLGPTIEVRSR
jgi:hypothetical protein